MSLNTAQSSQANDVVNQSIEADVLLGKIGDLSMALQEQHPDIATYVKQIHANLLQYPELVHILKPEQVQTIVKGIEKVAGEKILEDAKPKTRAKSTKKESLADLLAGI